MSFKTTTLDFYDDKGALLRGAINREDLPDFVKSASVVDSENTPVNQYALVLVEDGQPLKKFATADAGNTWISALYFAKTRHALPMEAQKIAASQLEGALSHYGIDVPNIIEKLAEGASGTDTNVVDVSGKSAPLSVRKDSNDVEYALELSDGTKKYPLDSAEAVKTALDYFELNQSQFIPRHRREYAVKVASVADSIGLPVNSSVSDYAGEGAARSDYSPVLADHLKLRRGYLGGEKAIEELSKLAKQRGSKDPESFAEDLSIFDRKHGLDELWDSCLVDPWKATIKPLEKAAHGTVRSATFQIGNEFVTEGDLLALKKMRKSLVDHFGVDFANNYSKDPVSFFGALPLPQKKLVARMASDVTNSGAY